MKKILTAVIVLIALQFISGDFLYAQLTSTPSGGNKKALVGERIGITDIVIDYSRPGVKKREGEIWGKLIPVGYVDPGFGNTKQAPWRAGANENTTIEFSTDVKIEGQPLAAGKYGFFIAYDPAECTLIFSKNSGSWGSFFYNPAEDALRIKVRPVPVDKSVEWLKYEFTDQTETSATVALQWEKLVIPFKIEVDLVATQLASFRKELQTDKGFLWESWAQAAQWCVQHNTNLDQALLWSDTATSIIFGGDKSFQAWSTKAQVLDKLGRSADAEAIMKKAMPYGNEFEIHQYGRQLLAQKKTQAALEVFKINYSMHPNDFVTNMGMARGYSATGDYKKALEFVQKAQPLATDPANKANAEKLIKMLQEGKDIN
ncbi:MAG TPA: DUF2911 domain-containing protein [Puia sp.]|nr:DUF2911 domain-containing protein [Puia sp.]